MATPLRALIIEDQEDDTRLLVRELARSGFDVTHRRVDTAEALDRALDTGEWDVVFADFTMPGFSGTTALSVIRGRGLDLPFIFVSGTIGEDVAVEAMRSGANDYVIKGNLKRLAPVVERELRDAAVRRERRLLEAQVRQAQRLESVGHLAGGLAHDFNNLLTVVLGNVELLLRSGLHPAQQAELEEVRGAAERARELTRQLLAFSRRQVLDPRPLDLNTVVWGMERMIARILGEDVEFEAEMAADLGIVRADPGRIEQVLLNLAVNARDAMPGGGRFRIRTANAELAAQPTGEDAPPAAGPYVELAVTDTGTGMPPEVLAHIFEPFFTTKPSGEGTGLGLATVYGIVTQSGGRIALESDVNVGTTFRIYLPRVDETAGAWPAAGADAPVRGGTESVLVVEDDPSVRAFMARVLRQMGYTIYEAGGAEEALRWLREGRARVALLVTDAVLPGCSGKAVADQAGALQPGIRLLFVSGHPEATLTRRGVIVPGAPLLEKPFSAAALARKVRDALDAG
ncbi:MAG TPA: response regulator [Gemmatimonadales bacterium]|nr:response regulator [Gemmatimonadales bacterium]